MSDNFWSFLRFLGDWKMFHYRHLRFLRNLVVLITRIVRKMLSNSHLVNKLQG